MPRKSCETEVIAAEPRQRDVPIPQGESTAPSALLLVLHDLQAIRRNLQAEFGRSQSPR